MNSKRIITAMTFVLATVIASLALPGAAFASDGKNNAALPCQNGGWMVWLRADQTAFKNKGDCVAYVTKGGTLISRYPAAQSLCESFSGTFGHDDQLSNDPTRPYLWTCNSLPADFPFPSGNDELASQCFADLAPADDGGPFVYSPDKSASTCFSKAVWPA
jgi:hypothetical protein